MEPLFYIVSPLALILVFVLNRLVDVPADARRNDQRVRARDEDLASWIEDDDKALKESLHRHRPSGVVGSVYPDLMERAQSDARHKIRHRYRDQHREAERLVRDIALSERWSHRLWRRMRRRPLPGLSAPERRADTLASWREPEPRGNPTTPAREACGAPQERERPDRADVHALDNSCQDRLAGEAPGPRGGPPCSPPTGSCPCAWHRPPAELRASRRTDLDKRYAAPT